MHRNLISCLGLLLAAGCEASVRVSAIEAETMPMFMHELSVAPGCYVARPPSDPVTTPDDGSMMAATAEMMELNASYNMQFQMLLNHLILSDPFAPRWNIGGPGPAGFSWEATIEPLVRRAQESMFTIEVLAEGASFAPDGSNQTTARRTTATGHSSPLGTVIEWGPAVYRWTDYAYTTTGPISRLVMEGTVAHVETTFGTELRGCDPETQISFEATPFEPLACWTATGESVSCSGVDLWP